MTFHRMYRQTLVAILACLVLAGAVLGYIATFSGKCVSIADGDTISVMKDGKEVKIRIDGIDCPEATQDFGAKAKEFTADLVFGKEVQVDIVDVDHYGRFVGRVFVDGKDLSVELVKAGLAWHYVQYSTDTVLANAEKTARAAKIGLWSLPNPIPPWDFRHGTVSEPQKIDTTAKTVYITNSGKKYHGSGCRYLAKSSIPISLTDAVARGYAPCSVCKPSGIPASQTTQIQKPQEEQDQIVYITRTGSKYHKASCQYLRSSAIPIPKKEAISKGYSPCSRCRP